MLYFFIICDLYPQQSKEERFLVQAVSLRLKKHNLKVFYRGTTEDSGVMHALCKKQPFPPSIPELSVCLTVVLFNQKSRFLHFVHHCAGYKFTESQREKCSRRRKASRRTECWEPVAPQLGLGRRLKVQLLIRQPNNASLRLTRVSAHIFALLRGTEAYPWSTTIQSAIISLLNKDSSAVALIVSSFRIICTTGGVYLLMRYKYENIQRWNGVCVSVYVSFSCYPL